MRLSVLLLCFVVVLSGAVAAEIWNATGETGLAAPTGGTGTGPSQSWRNTMNATAIADGSWDELQLCMYSDAGGAGPGPVTYSGVHICERDGTTGNCTAGTRQYFPDFSLPDSTTFVCQNLTNSSHAIDGTVDYLIGMWVPASDVNAKYWDDTVVTKNFRDNSGNVTDQDTWTVSASTTIILATYNMTGQAVSSTPPVTNDAPSNDSYYDMTGGWNYTPVAMGGIAFENCTLWMNSTYMAANATSITNNTVNTIELTNLTDGNDYQWYVSCAGDDGNDYNSTAWDVHIDLTDPNATIWSPLNNGTYYGNDNITVNITYNDNGALSNCSFYIYYENGTMFRENSTACSGTSTTWDNESFIPDMPGNWSIVAVTEDEAGNIDNETVYFTINGLGIATWDESTGLAVTDWNITISNSTDTYHFGPTNNTWLWNNFTDIATGSITVVVSASGYVDRTYYAVYNLGSYVALNAYLLDTASGIYPVFLVQDTSGNPIESSTLTWLKSINGTYVTVAQQNTDATGTTQQYLDPSTTYRLIVTATGYETYTTSSFQPVSTTYVITLGTNTSVNYSDVSDYLYARLLPMSPSIDNQTIVEFVCNDPWSNVVEFDLTIINSTGDIIYYEYDNASASCGIMNVNLTTIAANMTAFTRFTATGRILRSGVNYTYSREYYQQGSWASGLGYWLDETADNEWIDANGRQIIAVVIIGAVTLGAAITIGWGAGVVGILVAGVFAMFNWINIYLFIFALVFTLLAYASRRWS